MDSSEEKNSEVRPSDALGRLNERTKGSRVTVVIIAVVALIVGAFLIGMIVRGVSGGIENAPKIPSVEI